MTYPRAWQQRGWMAWLLWPLSQVYRALSAFDRARHRRGWRPIYRAPVPVVVIGNWVVGGAGKTPTLLLVLRLAQQWGWRVGVISRGYGRRSTGTRVASPRDGADELGDEPLLILRQGGVPLAVSERRADAAQALLQAHPDLQLILSDDGLQHHALARDLSLVVFGAQGLGNGFLLPAGPLRQDRVHAPLPGSRADALVLYSDGEKSAHLPGFVAHRSLGKAWPLAAWWQGNASAAVQLQDLPPGPLVACAGLAQPERFFEMLRQLGLRFDALPLPDHADFDPLPWPPTVPDVLITEKDAVKLRPERVPSDQRVWVLPLDLRAEPAFEQALHQALLGLLGRSASQPP